MRISFDLDDTLICDPDLEKEPERVPFILRFVFKERLRSGTVALMRSLIQDKWEIYIYTTSFRSSAYVKWLFWFYGITIQEVINQERHDTVFKKRKSQEMPSKYPSRWKIDLHVDDSEIVKKEGERFGFRVVCVDPRDVKWVDKVYDEAKKIEENQ